MELAYATMVHGGAGKDRAIIAQMRQAAAKATELTRDETTSKGAKANHRLSRNDEAAPHSASADQDRISPEYPRPDSNRRYRHRGIEGSSDNVRIH